MGELMAIDRSRRITFEEVAELYDQVRPSYPEELVEDALALSGIPARGRILEIGCGPGAATIPFARRGYRIVGVELGERLAALAVKNCRAYPGVEIQHHPMHPGAHPGRAGQDPAVNVLDPIAKGAHVHLGRLQHACHCAARCP